MMCNVVFALLAGVCVCAMPSISRADNQTESTQQIGDFSLTGFGEKGKKSWDINGKSADIFDDVVKLKEIYGNLYGDKENVTLTADRGDFDKIDGKVHLQDNVVITTTSGAKLTTDSLDWDRKNQLVSTIDKVNITKQNMVTEATGAMGKPNLNTMVLVRDVKVTMSPEEAQEKALDFAKNQIVITCVGPLEIDYAKSVARFNIDVRADKSDSIIFCDVMELYFAKNSKQAKDTKPSAEQGNMMMNSKLDKIVCSGNVRIVRGENVSYSDEAVYTAADQKITLKGKPKLVIYTAQDFKGMMEGN
jgi:LPS export ABC transporter protein LptC